MKLITIAIFALLTMGCSILQPKAKEVYYEWDTSGMDKGQLEEMRAVHKECGDFAYRSKVAGSRYAQDDIHMSCMNRRGYKMNRYVVGD